jgi:hypothetical protein
MRDFDKADQDELFANSATYIADDPKKARLSQSEDRYVDLTVLYNGKAVERLPHASGEERIPAPMTGDTIFKIKNISKIRVGVVLGVNGVNNLFEEVIAEKAPENCRKIVLEPGEEQEIRGFRNYDNTVKPFKVSEDLSKVAVYGDKLGLLQLCVFREGPVGTTNSRPEMKISFRGLSNWQLQKSPPNSIAELQVRLAREMPTTGLPKEMVNDLTKIRREALDELNPLKTKGFLVPGEAKPDTPVQVVPFKNPQLIMQEVIRYYDPKSGQ